jgi:hypothetical protein
MNGKKACIVIAAILSGIMMLGIARPDFSGSKLQEASPDNHPYLVEGIYFTLLENKNVLSVLFDEGGTESFKQHGIFSSDKHIIAVVARTDRTKEVCFIEKDDFDMNKKYTTFIVENDLFYRLCDFFDVMHFWNHPDK